MVDSTYDNNGDYVEITAAAAASQGDVVVLNNLLGVAVHDAAIGDTLKLATRGVYELPAKSADTIAQGQKVFWDTGNVEITETEGTGFFLAGTSIEVCGSGDTTCKVRLDGIQVTAVPA